MIDHIKMLAAKAAISNMVEKGYIDICAIDSVLQMLGQTPGNREAHNILRTLHCINFNKIDNDLRRELPHLIKEVLRSDGVDWTIIFLPAVPPQRFAEPTVSQERTSFWRLLK